jgi:hypothetical protein
MKHIRIFLLLSVSIFPVAAPAQDQKPAAPAHTLASVVTGQIDSVEKQLLAAAETMPEEKYNFSPDNLNIPGSRFKDVRSFALQLKHVAASNYAIWSALSLRTISQRLLRRRWPRRHQNQSRDHPVPEGFLRPRPPRRRNTNS